MGRDPRMAGRLMPERHPLSLHPGRISPEQQSNLHNRIVACVDRLVSSPFARAIQILGRLPVKNKRAEAESNSRTLYL